MRLTDLFNKGKCLVRLHAGEWKLTSPAECSFTLTCIRCHNVQYKVEHLWDKWSFVAEASCNQVRICSRCQHQEQRLVHTWKEPTYKANGSCGREQVCARCAAVQSAPARHVMDQWRYVSADLCTQVQYCSRCNSDGNEERVQHRWGEWQFSDLKNAPVRVCLRCGEMQLKATGAQ